MRQVWQGRPAVPGKAPQVDIHKTNEEQDAGSAPPTGTSRQSRVDVQPRRRASQISWKYGAKNGKLLQYYC
jgi:hypothetical protein